MKSIFIILPTICCAGASAQKITSFTISNGWSGRYNSEHEEIAYSDSNASFHMTSSSTLEIDQPGNTCTILGYPLAPKYVPVNANVIEAVYFYDSLTRASQFEVVITPEILKSIHFLHNRFYQSDADITGYPFTVKSDTLAVLEPALFPKSKEIDFVLDGIGAGFWCTIVYDYKDTVRHGISGNYELSSTMYLDTTLPIFCLFQQYPNVFKELNYFAPVRESDIGEIIFRFIRWKKEEERKEMEDGTQRKNIQIGSEVEIVEKHNQRSGDLTDGIVERILTKSPNHPHGIKVLLETGEVGSR